MSAQLSAVLLLGVQAFLVALSGAMSPGSYLTVTIARTMQKGPFSAALMLVGHALLEAALLVAFAFGFQRLLKSPSVMTVIALAGGAVLVWMGFELLRGAIAGTIAADLEVTEQSTMSGHPLGAVAQGAVVSLSNPYWTLWWATIGVKLAADGLTLGWLGIVAFFVGHQLADVSWYLFVISVVHRGRSLLNPVRYRVTMGVLATALLYIGARFVGEGVGIHLPWLPF